MTVSKYFDLCNRQPSDWLRRSANDPSPSMRPIHVAITRLVLRRRGAATA